MNSIRFIALLAIISLFAFPAQSRPTDPPPDVPCRIGGTISVNGQPVTHTTDTGCIVIATRQDMTPFNPPAKDEDGLNDHDWYHLDVPLHEPDGIEPGQTIILHIYLNGSKLLVTSPAGGYVTVDPQENHTLEVHLEAVSSPTSGSRIYTEEQMRQAVADARAEAVRNFDVHLDGRIGLPEAIHALRVVSGF